jgi:hypothetical protein
VAYSIVSDRTQWYSVARLVGALAIGVGVYGAIALVLCTAQPVAMHMNVTGYNVAGRGATCNVIDEAWRHVWGCLGLYRAEVVTTRFSPRHHPLASYPPLPSELEGIHITAVDVTFALIPFAHAVAAYHLATLWFLRPRCATCGKVLRRMKSAACPACHAPL